VTVAFDALGAEGGPEVVIEGVRAVAAEGIGVRVFGRRDDLSTLDSLDGVEVIATTESIGNDEEPVRAIR
jgi:fatty acid/phospholipid biosynthesis enzyme